MVDFTFECDPTIDEIVAHDGLVIDPERHEVLPDGEWVYQLQKQLELPSLFIYWHKETKKFVLAAWTVKDKGICKELEILEGCPGKGAMLPSMEYMRRRTRPVWEQMSDIATRIRGRRQEARDLEIDSELERADKVVHLRRMGLDDSAKVLESGVPFTGKKEGGAALEQVKEGLADMKKMHWRNT